MQIDSTSSVYQTQTQMRKMDGSGGGQGKGGMNSLIQALPIEDQTVIKDQMQSLSQEDRVAAVEQIKQLDTSSMSTDLITQSIMDIINPTTSTQETTSILKSLYA